ncbi:MAG TPA: sialidase family protein [Candidatus Thermoplasmatota archaeon]|jgi:hypothetical protein|nr:sialidase family protein [Candidatus Thermoplasmatota archaeon]
MRFPVLLALAVLALPLLPALPAAPASEPAWWEQPLGIPESGPAPASEGATPPLPLFPGDDVIVAVPNNQNEYGIAANPRNADNLVAGANDYELGDAWAGFYTTFDGGATWTHGRIPLPALYTVSGDPTLVFDQAGNAYYGGIAFNRGSTNNGANAIFVSKSLDGGLTWSTVTPFTSPSGATFHDKPYINADPVSGAIYLTYTHFGSNGGISFSKSTNGGLAWTPRVVIGGGQFSLPVAGQGGEIFVTWTSGGAKFARSLDGGATWSVTTPLSISIGEVPVGFRIFAYPVMDVARGGPHAGRVYLAAPQRLVPGVAGDLTIITSDDGGLSWSEPEAIVRPGTQLMPWMAVQPDGTVGIAYMDTILTPWSWVNSPPGSAPTLLLQSLSTKGPDDPAWLTTITTDLPSRSDTASFWGDYQGMAATSAGFHPAFGDGRNGDACNCNVAAKLDFGTMRVSGLGLPLG